MIDGTVVICSGNNEKPKILGNALPQLAEL